MDNNIGLITLYGNSNFGNKLQNYAIQTILEKYGYKVTTLRTYNSNYKFFSFFRNRLKYFIKKIYPHKLYRNSNFKKFEKKYLKNSKRVYFSNENNIKLNKSFNYFVVGSDQVWNPTFGLSGNFKLLDFAKNRVSFSASFGVDDIPFDQKKQFKKSLYSFKGISVREEQGKKIIESIDKNIDVKVLLDPTMLLTSEEWDRIVKKPKNMIDEKYILNYFLGKISTKRKKAIEKVAKKYNCKIINLLDKSDPFYSSGPSEFLYLEKNAFLICTDSFHSSVFSILFNRPFVVFEREDSELKMNSRINTLISKLNLKNRIFNKKEITIENLNHDYSETYELLLKERKKSEMFLRDSFNIKESE